MKETSSDSPSFLDRVGLWNKSKAHGNPSHSADSRGDSTLPVSNSTTRTTTTTADPEKQNKSATSFRNDTTNIPTDGANHYNGLSPQRSHPTSNNVADNTSNEHPPPAPPPQTDGEGNIIGTTEDEKPKRNVAMRFWLTSKHIILSSYINLLLVFVPVGIAAYAVGLSPGLIFAMNAIAIIPLAGLLSHATESVAKRMGDTVGALMNVTFGNAVELIILYVPAYPLTPHALR
jgi:Ca2+:H+ antiporter